MTSLLFMTVSRVLDNNEMTLVIYNLMVRTITGSRTGMSTGKVPGAGKASGRQ